MEGYLGPMSWSEAMSLNGKVNGWRVPDEDELKAICEAGYLKPENYRIIETYCSSSKVNSDKVISVDIT